MLDFDIDYRFRPASRFPLAVAQRAAVLPVLAPTQYRLGEGDATTAYAGMWRWRERALELRAEQWDFALTQLPVLRNCHPAGFRTGLKVVRTCGQQRVCPWCWARATVTAVYGPLWAACSAVPDLERYDLLSYSFPARAPALDAYSELEVLFDRQRRYWSDLGALGGVFQGSAEPDGACVGLCRLRLRALVAWQGKIPGNVPKRGKIRGLHLRLLTAGSLGRLGRLVARFAAYPRGMMDGSAVTAVALLKQRAPKMLRFFGCCYGCSSHTTLPALKPVGGDRYGI